MNADPDTLQQPDQFTSEILSAFTQLRNGQEDLNKTGYYYNVFFALGLEKREAILHSKFLADLLNPDGWHGQKDLFLIEFLQQVGQYEKYQSETELASVVFEKDIGPVNVEYSTGGSIDIIIKFRSLPPILIENKIDACDQPGQLFRYKQYYPSSVLYYLTLDGSRPSEHALRPLVGDYPSIIFSAETGNYLVSYRETILNWLLTSIEKLQSTNPVYQLLMQYTEVIETITNRRKPDTMAKQMAQTIISSTDNLYSFFDLIASPAIKAVEKQLMEKFVEDLTHIAQDLGLETDKTRTSPNLGHTAAGSAIWFSIPGTAYSLSFGFDECRQSSSIGIHCDSSRNAMMHTQLRSRLSEILGRHHVDLGHPEWQYLLYLKCSKRQDTYLDTWYQGDKKIWGGLLDGSVSKNLGFYLKMFFDELTILGLIGTRVVRSQETSNLVENHC